MSEKKKCVIDVLVRGYSQMISGPRCVSRFNSSISLKITNQFFGVFFDSTGQCRTSFVNIENVSSFYFVGCYFCGFVVVVKFFGARVNILAENTYFSPSTFEKSLFLPQIFSAN